MLLRRVASSLLTTRGIIVCTLTVALLCGCGVALALRARISVGDGSRETFAGVHSGELSMIEVDRSNGDVPPTGMMRIATTRRITGDAGVYIESAERGRRIRYQGAWPKFVSARPFHSAVERAIQTEVEQAARENLGSVWSDWQDFWWTVREPTFSNQWEFEDNWQITFHNERLISLLCLHSSYTGGAHPNSHFSNRTYLWTGDRAILVNLAEFFQPQSDWQSKLCRLIGVDLQEQKSQDVPIEMFFDDLACFTLSANGIDFHFAPYEKGCYAEGPFEVHIPFTKIREWLRTDGPVAALNLSETVARRE